MFGESVHIVPVQREVEFVVEPAVEQGADVVHLLSDASLANGETVATLTDELGAAGIDVETHPCPHDDLYVVMGLVTTLASEYDNDQDAVFVNIAAGGRVAAVGASLACMDAATDARAFDIDVEHGAEAREFVSGSMLPDHVIQSPGWQLVAGMAIIAGVNRGPAQMKKRHLIDHGLKLTASSEYETKFTGLASVVETLVTEDGTAKDALVRDGFDAVGDHRNSAYRYINTDIVNPLAERGYIEVESVGRSSQLQLTEAGENVLRAFRHKVEDVIAFENQQRRRHGGSLPDWLVSGFRSMQADGAEPPVDDGD